MASIQMSYPHELFGFEVLAHLGNGARSSIYAVKDNDDQVYALKHVVKENADDQRFLDQALTDHNVASMFNFPNLRHGFRVIRHRKLIRINEIALLMELVDGQSLEEAATLLSQPLCHALKPFEAAFGTRPILYVAGGAPFVTLNHPGFAGDSIP